MFIVRLAILLLNTTNAKPFITVALDYLREENNILPRLGAITIGGLTGYIFALRGGKIKRFVYFTTGAGINAALCYPKEAKESVHYAKHYGNIGYNFVYGGKGGVFNHFS